MALRIIDNKRIDLDDYEFAQYQAICNSYTLGADLFKGLFETDHDGLIIHLNPPRQQTSMEIIAFLQNIMVQQQMRKLNNYVNSVMQELKDKVDNYIKNK